MEKKNAVQLVREIRKEMYKEWKKDPISFKEKIKQDPTFLNEKYGKSKQAA